MSSEEREHSKTDFGDHIATADAGGKRKWIYALQPRGRLYNLRSIISLLYLLVFFTLPFIRIKGNPLFLFNFPEATFIFFGKVFLPQDFLLVGIGMLVCLLFIVVFTLLFGRVFCGWACPQTVFMEMVFRRIEYWIEGPANKQAAANRKTWTTEIYIRKAVKHLIFFLIALLIAHTFLAYIIGTPALFRIMTEPVTQHIGGFIALLAFSVVFYIVFAFVREIVCTVICPYGRLQSVLLDKNSIVVAYDYLRGEPRSRRRKETAATPTGDCIDCNLCVQVCPTGIDIRDGIQLECVNCTACIDACNMMMKKVNRAPDLIRLASENSIAAGTKPRLTGRVKAFSLLLLALLSTLVILLATRSMFDATLLRVPGQILQEHADGTISNLYRIKIVSKSLKPEPYHIETADGKAKIELVGKPIDSLYTGVASEETFFIKLPAAQILQRKQKIHIRIMSGNEVIQTKTVTFIGQY